MGLAPETDRTRLAHAPLDSEGARFLVQQRISPLARVELVLGLCIQVVVVAVHLGSPAHPFATGSGWTVYAHLFVLAGFTAIWLRTRRGSREAIELGVLDVACVALPTAFSAFALWQAPLSVRPSQIFALSATQILILRAILVPGTGRRSALLGAAACLVIGPWTYLHHRHHGGPDALLDSLPADRGEAPAGRAGGGRPVRAGGAAHGCPHSSEHHRDLRLWAERGRHLLLRDGAPRRARSTRSWSSERGRRRRGWSLTCCARSAMR